MPETMQHTGTLALALLASLLLTGCAALPKEQEERTVGLTVLSADPQLPKVRLTNQLDRDLAVTAQGFRLVDGTGLAKGVTGVYMLGSEGFPNTLTLGPGQSAQGLLQFDTDGTSGPYMLVYDWFGGKGSVLLIPDVRSSSALRTTSTPAGWTTYTSHDGAYSLSHPSTWTPTTIPGAEFITLAPETAPPSFRTSLNVLRVPVNFNDSMETLIQGSVAQLAEFITDFKLHSSGFQGEAAWIRFEGRQGSYDVQFNQSFRREGPTLYIATLSADLHAPAHWTDGLTALATFQLGPATASPPPPVKPEEPNATTNPPSHMSENQPAQVGEWIHGDLMSARLVNWSIGKNDATGHNMTFVSFEFDYHNETIGPLTFAVRLRYQMGHYHDVKDTPQRRTFGISHEVVPPTPAVEITWVQAGSPEQMTVDRTAFVWNLT